MFHNNAHVLSPLTKLDGSSVWYHGLTPNHNHETLSPGKVPAPCGIESLHSVVGFRHDEQERLYFANDVRVHGCNQHGDVVT